MCCRYVLDYTEKDLAELLADAAESPLLERFRRQGAGALVRGGDVRPTNVAPAIATSRRGEQAVFPMRWGFTFEGRRGLLVNARVETAAEKPAFRELWRRHRCILPASRYYEWQKLPDESGKTVSVQYEIRPCDTAITWLCGLYRIENGLPVFVVLTTAPSPDLAQIHDRMPLILPKDCVRAWIDPAIRAEELLPCALTRFDAMRAG